MSNLCKMKSLPFVFVFVSFVIVFVSLCVIVLLFSVGAESALFQLCATLPNYTSATNVLCPFGRAGFTSEIFKSGLSHVSCISYIPKWERFSVYSPVKVFKTVGFLFFQLGSHEKLLEISE